MAEGADPRRQALRRRALLGRRRSSARRARRARSSSAAARSTRRSCWSCPASASPSCCARSASRGARAARRRREPARPLLAAHEIRRCRRAEHHLQRQGARAGGCAREALKYALFGTGFLASTAVPDPHLFPHPRGAGDAGRDDFHPAVPVRDGRAPAPRRQDGRASR